MGSADNAMFWLFSSIESLMAFCIWESPTNKVVVVVVVPLIGFAGFL